MFKNFKINIYLLLFLGSCAVLSFVAVRAYGLESRFLRIDFLDVGQGDAILIRAPNGNKVLIDGGPDNRVLGELGRLMPFIENKIDMLVLTHPHADHVNGLIEVFKNYKVGKVLENKTGCDTPECQAWNFVTKQAETFQAERGQTVDLGTGIKLKIIYARPAGTGSLAFNQIHNYMLIIELVYGDESVLFMGDAEKNIEKEISRSNITAQFLKVGHHGSKTSTARSFLEAVKPEVAFIEVGRDNRYGHPSPEVVSRLENLGIKYYRTDRDGSVELVLDGQSYLIK